MPRTIESILACHQEAAARRRAGRRIWDVTLPLKEVKAPYVDAGDDLSAAQAIELSHKIGAMLEARVPRAWRQVDHGNYNMDFEDLVERFSQACEADFTPTKEWPDSPCDVIDQWLDELYDWGDRYRVWIGS